MMKLSERVNHDICAAIRPGAFMADYIPQRECSCANLPFIGLKVELSVEYLPDWLPGMGYRKVTRQMRETLLKFVNVPFDFVKSQIVR
jgi:hypothetical protein